MLQVQSHYIKPVKYSYHQLTSLRLLSQFARQEDTCRMSWLWLDTLAEIGDGLTWNNAVSCTDSSYLWMG